MQVLAGGEFPNKNQEGNKHSRICSYFYSFYNKSMHIYVYNPALDNYCIQAKIHMVTLNKCQKMSILNFHEYINWVIGFSYTGYVKYK